MAVRDVVARGDREAQVRADAPLEALLASEPLRRLGALMAVDADGRLRGVVTMEQVSRALRRAPRAVLSDDPAALRAAIRAGEFTGPTAGVAREYTQANLVALPEADAFDFLRFCLRNPKPCPVLEVTEPGSPEPAGTRPAPTCAPTSPATACGATAS